MDLSQSKIYSYKRMHTFKYKNHSPNRRKLQTQGVNRTHEVRDQSFEKVPVDKQFQDTDYRQSQDTQDAFSQIIRETKTYFMDNNDLDNLKVSLILKYTHNPLKLNATCS